MNGTLDIWSHLRGGTQIDVEIALNYEVSDG